MLIFLLKPTKISWRYKPTRAPHSGQVDDFLKLINNQKPKTKEIMHRDVFGYLMKNSSFLHP